MEMSFSMIGARIADALEADERRGAVRLAVDFDARVRPLGEEGHAARIVNISETGFMAESDADYSVGARIWLILPGRDRANAQVKWVSRGRLGAEFAEPMTLD